MKLSEAFPSKYLKADDIEQLGEPVLTIKSVEMESLGQGNDKETKPLIMFRELEKGMIANKTNCTTITKVLGSDDTDDWIGKKIILKAMEVQSVNGDMVMGIRVSIKKPSAAPAKPKPSEAAEDADSDIPF